MTWFDRIKTIGAALRTLVRACRVSIIAKKSARDFFSAVVQDSSAERSRSGRGSILISPRPLAGEGGRKATGRGSLRSLLIAIFFAITLNTTTYANPQGGQIVAGDATIEQAANLTTIHQTSNKAAINWNTFNIGAGERTHFNQPNASSITLNRVTGGHGGI